MDKSTWGDGPWQSEPDLVRWTYRGVPCLIVRTEHTGSLCGYVAVRRGHPYYFRDYDSVPLGCHGGLTFSGVMPPELGGKAGWWWLGFDCAHAFDLMPAMDSRMRGAVEYMATQGVNLDADWAKAMGPPGGRYRDLEYVTTHVETMARWVAQIPIQRWSYRRERRLLGRLRHEARRELVRLAGQAQRGGGLAWETGFGGVRARTAIRRLSYYPTRGVKVPRSLRGYWAES